MDALWVAGWERASGSIGKGRGGLVGGGTDFSSRRSDFMVSTGIGDGAVDAGHYDLPVDD